MLADVDFSNTITRYDDKAVILTLPNDLSDLDFTVGNAYPNPFNPRTSIELQLSKQTLLDLRIYDTQGRLVESLFSNWADAGTHTFSWDADDRVSGVYILKLQAGVESRIQKLVLMK